MKGKYKKIGLTAIALCSLAMIIVWNLTYTIASDEKSDNFYSYGYKIEKYYFWRSTRITFWSKYGLFTGMNATYDLSKLNVNKIIEQRWIKNDQAIFLNLEIEYYDSISSLAPAKIIYDFHQGEIHASSPFALWRLSNKENKTKSWTTESEFDEIFNKLNQ